MPPRKKSKFEQWFSFSRHKRRFGADKVYQTLANGNIEQLKITIIQEDTLTYTYGSATNLN